jgi:subtilase family serine protease
LTGKGAKWTQSAWNTLKLDECGGSCGATGSGCSEIVPKPTWQHDSGCKMRSESDVSAVADVTTPVWIYSTDPGVGGWAGFGGTSASAPIISGIFALAGNATKVSQPQGIWSHGGTSAFTDVTKGTNFVTGIGGPCASSAKYICTSGKGYDGPTGWGTPNGTTDL